jgi:hypothetical protein
LIFFFDFYFFSSAAFSVCENPVADDAPDRTFFVPVSYEGSLPDGLTFEGYEVTIGVSEIQINLGNYIEFDA